ncbi:phosphotransferase [uncultured Imperialibacter sp.]|uniref:phosphotransferase enzyme family protein n=1 Tax=uncultured Imperialibacter sp. TaxID=1672639 RepID=UPI0030DB6051|tara:strand:- start:1391 stop:2383 length:993 start_codon:yes stop_codon:yes gene_type:complete
MNSLFPTSYSTLSASALGQYIAKAYNWTSVSCELLLRGVGDTYVLETSDQQHILRVYRHDIRTYEHVAAEVELLLQVKAAGVPVSVPIADTNGRYIHTFEAAEGKKYGVLFSFAPGQFVSVLDDNQLETLGFEMARFHEVSTNLVLTYPRWTFDLETTLQRPLKMIAPYFADDKEDYGWLQHAAEKASAAIKEVDDSSFAKGYCHYDFMPKNFHIDDNGQFTFFDFDFMGYGWLVNDVMTFKVSLDLDVQYGKLKRDAADAAFAAFLKAYQSQKIISNAELSMIPHLSLGFWLFYLGFYTTHDQFLPLLQPPHLGRRVQMIRQMMEQHGY